jgi:ankyrin repeat protein
MYNENIEQLTHLVTNSQLDDVLEFTSSLTPKEITHLVNTRDSSDDYPIHIAVKNRKSDITKWLLDNGANIDAVNYWDRTP